MRRSRIIGMAVAALIAVPLTGVTAASASFAARDDGYGATLAAAEQNAKEAAPKDTATLQRFLPPALCLAVPLVARPYGPVMAGLAFTVAISLLMKELKVCGAKLLNRQ